MKRLLSIILCITLIVCIFAGCADSEIKTPQDDAVVTTVPEVTDEVTTTEVTTTEEATTTEATTTDEVTTTTEEVTTITTTTEIVTTTEATTTLWYEVTPTSEKLYATADLTVRAEPDKSATRISHIDKGDLVEVTGYTDNGWARIKFRDGEYFINASYLSQEKPAEEVTTVATTAATTVATTEATAKSEGYYYDYTKSKFDLTTIMETESLKELCEDYFKLGVGLTGSARNNGAVNSEDYMAIVYKHFNSVTLTNLMKPSFLLDQSGCKRNAKSGNEAAVAVTFENVDPTLKWCYENGIQMRGHTLVWHTQTPDWFFREGYSDTGAYVDYETMAARLDSYIKQVVTYCQETYPGVIYCWDVVNEAVDIDSGDKNSFFLCRTTCDGKDNPWYKTLGEDYVELAFTSARKYADDDVKLFYNDYNTFQSGKLESIYKLCDYLKGKGLIDGIGMQGYWGLYWPATSDIEKAINTYAKLGLEIHITELSVGIDSLSQSDLKKQADKYAEFFKMFKRLDTQGGGKANITSVTLFGLMDGFVMYDKDDTKTRLLDKDFQPKPCFYSIQEVLETYR